MGSGVAAAEYWWRRFQNRAWILRGVKRLEVPKEQVLVMGMHYVLSLLVVSGLLLARAQSEEIEADPAELPRVAPVEPEDAPGTFRVRPGYRIELMAAEPLVADPIAMAFDENGRLFVVEMRGYSEREEKRLGRVRVLDDPDAKGRFQRSVIFAEGLRWPTAIICFDGGVFVGDTPDILYLKDTTGDGKPDVRERVFTGFGNLSARINVQQLLNSFQWGLDNRIHGALGGNPGRITVPDRPDLGDLELRGRDFSFDPVTRSIRPENGGGQYGLSFDDAGRKFVCSNSRHIQVLQFQHSYAARNPFYTMPNPLLDIAADGPAAEVFRVSPDEPWRVLRTNWRVSGIVPGPIEGGGRPSGYFTGATGLTIYRGDAWPESDGGDAFIADIGSNLVHRKKLREEGLELVAERAGDEQEREFLASTDRWFRPVQFANAPDGTFYVADMYREVVEHPWSLPEPIKKHLDLNSGLDRGRIYRIVPEGFEHGEVLRLGAAGLGELVKTLEHANGWHRETAARLLFERQDMRAVEALATFLGRTRSWQGRMHALYSLAGLKGLSAEHLLKGLTDGDARVREHAVRLSEHWLQGEERGEAEIILEQLRKLSADDAIRVRYQLAFTVGEIGQVQWSELLAEILGRDPEDRWICAAVLSSLREGAPDVFVRLLQDLRIRALAKPPEGLVQLARLLGATETASDREATLARISELENVSWRFSLLTSWSGGLALNRAERKQGGFEESLEAVFGEALQIAENRRTPMELRVQAIQLAGQNVSEAVEKTLLGMIGTHEPQGVQMAAVLVLARTQPKRLMEEMLGRWDSLEPRIRRELLPLFLARGETVALLLKALEEQTVLRSEMAAGQMQLLRSHSNWDLRQRAIRLLGAASPGSRSELVQRYEAALDLSGDSKRGRGIFEERCASCHRFGNEGHDLGPDLVTVKSAGKEKLLGDILDPNREVAAQFIQYEIETQDGEQFSGMIVRETDRSLVLRGAFGREQEIFRQELRSLRSSGQSVMPEGLEEGLDAQAMADLLEFIVGSE
jgi:putative membrane-bound dehydrogenase-like protein